jgi:hypothetical protein
VRIGHTIPHQTKPDFLQQLLWGVQGNRIVVSLFGAGAYLTRHLGLAEQPRQEERGKREQLRAAPFG